MNRHLFLVFNHGDKFHPLPNVKVDRDGYQKFFQSPEGGYWDKDEEMSVYNDNFHLEYLKDYIESQKKTGTPCELIVFVFCGHGCTDTSGEYWFEVRPDGTAGADVSLSQFKQVCKGVRTLLISDACSALYTGPLHERRLFSFHGSITDSSSAIYALKCRTLYNAMVLLTPQDTFTAGFAAAKGESAGENENGGYYSQSILKGARMSIEQLKNSSIYRHLQYLPFAQIHEEARPNVIKLSEDTQHPIIDMPRSKAQLPFVVVAKTNI